MTTTVSVTEETTPNRSDWAGAAARSLPSAALAACALAEAWRERGSIAGPDWLGYAIVAGLVLAVVALAGVAVRPRRSVTGAAAGLTALAGWDAISIAWSARPDLARDEALLTVLYAVALLVPALTARRLLDRVLVTATIVAAVGGLAVASAVEVAGTSSIGGVYYDRRLDFPVSYMNAEAAFVLLAVWPGLALAAMRRLPVLLRAVSLGAASACAAAWALTQSKGGALGLAVSTVVVFGLSRQRLRIGVPFAIATALVAGAFVPLTRPYRSTSLATVHDAGRTALAVAAAGFLAGLLYAAVDRRVVLGPRVTRAAASVAVLGLAVAVASATTVFFVRVNDPADFFAAQWRSFKHLPANDTASTHFVSLGSNRYDFWRVAVDEFRQHPIAGIGARGFREAYLLHRRSSETPARAHSVELDALAETGVLGLFLLATALACAAAAIVPRARSELLALGAAGALACWLAHASVDWTWSFPAVGIPVFALVGAAAAGGERRLRTGAAVPLGLAAAALALGGFGVPWLAARYVRAALASPAAPGADLRHARALDPLSIEPYLARWALAPTARAGIAPLAAAVRLQPRSPDLLYALGRQQLLAGDGAAGRRTLEHALRLAPADPAILALLHRTPPH